MSLFISLTVPRNTSQPSVLTVSAYASTPSAVLFRIECDWEIPRQFIPYLLHLNILEFQSRAVGS
ncbi:hypothetical protein [Peribacillus sp. RS7]|uniref:hypothetical protein n=1 Tax=Peribacillus sp. RS7 TaxID=3242679 RepID=UPI0035C17BDC